MKRLSIVLACVALLVFGIAVSGMAGTAPATGIKGSFHDLSTGGASATWGDVTEQALPRLDRVCIYCHTPHHAIKPTDAATLPVNPTNYVPLWNHAITTQATWSLYSPGTDLPNDLQHFPESTLSATSPGGVSILCLSCHDGTVAVNQYGFTPASSNEKTGTVGAKMTTADRAGIGVGGNLQNHHPIGFDYTSVCSPSSLNPAGCTGNDDEINGPDTPVPGLTGKTINDLLWNNTMQCASCHDVHNTKSQGLKLTWVMDTQSAFCFTCHKK